MRNVNWDRPQLTDNNQRFQSMVIEPGQTHLLSLPGEVVEIYEREGHCLTKIALKHSNLLDFTAENLQYAHLGDRVVIDARITIERIRPQEFDDNPGPDLARQLSRPKE
jgi:hypothetical protein